jgi:hypothetical protein
LNTVLGTQAVTLDVAAFGLMSMAEQAERCDDSRAAGSAKRTAWLLISLMMITVLSVAVGALWPAVKPYTDMADKVLILARVGLTVLYSHVVHSLRRHVEAAPQMIHPDALEELADHLKEHMQQVARELVTHQHQELHTLRVALREVTTQVAQLPTSEPVNYAALAEQIVPLLPAPAVPDMTPLVEQMAALSTWVQEMQQQVSETVDANGARDVNRDVATLEDTEGDTPVDIAAYRNDDRVGTEVATRRRHKVTTSGGYGAAQQKAARIMKKYPQIGATELAQKANISRSYAQRLLTEHRDHSA